VIDPRLDELLSTLKMTQRRALMTQCDNQLERVVVDGPGEWTVYNSTDLAAKVIARRDRKHVQPAPNRVVLSSEPLTAAPPSPPAAPKQPRRIKEAPAPPVTPPVLLRPVPVARFTQPTHPTRSDRGPVSTRHGVPGDDFDWRAVPLEPMATQLADHYRPGLPYPLSYSYHDDVLALQGVDIESADAAVRAPQRVEIRPETSSKGYPVLMFVRGDVQVVMGFRNPLRPVVIAAYWTALLVHDVDRPGYSSGMAGGGRREKGHTSPGTVPKLVQSLKARGCELEWDLLTTKPVEVTYLGEKLGKIPVDKQARRDVQFTWSRILNKILAIDRRRAEQG
jgi:hypothetical protein